MHGSKKKEAQSGDLYVVEVEKTQASGWVGFVLGAWVNGIERLFIHAATINPPDASILSTFSDTPTESKLYASHVGFSLSMSRDNNSHAALL